VEEDEGILAVAALTLAEREELLARLLGQNSLTAMEALRQSHHALGDDPTNHTLIDAYYDRMEDLFCEHINRTISVTGTIMAGFDRRLTADEMRQTLEEARQTIDAGRIDALEERTLEAHEEGA